MPISFSGLFLLIVMVPSIALSLAIYIFQAVGIYTISKRCGLNKSYLAFIPIANYYQIGLLADQYERPAKIGKLRYSLTPLAALQMIGALFALIFLYRFLGDIFAIIPSSGIINEGDMQDIMMEYMPYILLMSLYSFISIPTMVLYCIALYKIYKITNPANAVLFLLLSIFVTGSQAVILFISRNKPLVFPNEQQRWQ